MQQEQLSSLCLSAVMELQTETWLCWNTLLRFLHVSHMSSGSAPQIPGSTTKSLLTRSTGPVCGMRSEASPPRWPPRGFFVPSIGKSGCWRFPKAASTVKVRDGEDVTSEVTGRRGRGLRPRKSHWDGGEDAGGQRRQRKGDGGDGGGVRVMVFHVHKQQNWEQRGWRVW